uniref:Probable transposase for insertion sequence element IS1353 n=1 Tax=Curvibacter symbiont subsp. Hydra magnipapillata TaxID=667019 RepID=C9Y952_CURXX|nr:Probable transposase for insertion sequence element IS1353 [Curvibacter putative symbiont of Hydra magnipapillata]
MYSYEERIRAVKLYIKLGGRLGATIRKLGYPTKNSLISWYREYEREQDLQVGYSRAPSKYSAEQKQRAVQHYLDHDQCIAATLRALGYPCRELLTRWIDELHPQLRLRMVGRAPNVQHPPETKNAAVVELCTRTTNALTIAESVGVFRPTLYNWKNQLLGREASASMKRRQTSQTAPKPKDLTELEQQVLLLERDIRRLQLEHDLLKKANELLKKGLGVAPQLLSNREKTLLVDALKNTYTLAELLCELDLARSSYFYHCARLRNPDKYAEARIAIAEVFQSNHRCYGYRRMRAALGRRHVHISEKVVQRLMKQECLVVAANKRCRYGSYLGEISPAPENLINRDFQAESPNEKWLTDITEFQIPAGKVYLSPMIDCFDGMVVSWTIGTRPDSDLVNTMLDAAIERVACSANRPVIHSDRGAHYRWPGWLTRVDNAKLIRSMSRKGCSPDNAACEGFFGRLKTEMFYPRNWQDVSVDQFMQTVDAYIRWYNEKRIKISLGSLSPVEYRASLGINV